MHSRSDIHYLLVNRILTIAHQYYLVSCSDGHSVFSERIAFHTAHSLQTNIQPYFRSVQPQYRVPVDLGGDDVQVFEVEAMVSPAAVLLAAYIITFHGSYQMASRKERIC